MHYEDQNVGIFLPALWFFFIEIFKIEYLLIAIPPEPPIPLVPALRH